MDTRAMIRRINAELLARGISKAQFYKDCEITSGAYSQWNTGRSGPSRKTISRIAAYFGWDEEFLLTGIKKDSPPELGELSEDEINLVRDIRALPDDLREAVVTLVRSKKSLADQQGKDAANPG